MSSKKSDILGYAPAHGAPADTGWRTTLLSNLPVPLVLAVLIPIAWFVQGRTFGPYNQRVVMLIGFNIILAVSLQLINGFSGQFSLGHAGFMMVGAYLAAYPTREYSNHFHDPAATLVFFISLAIVVGIGGAIAWGMFRLLQLSRFAHRSLPGVLLVVLLIWLLTDFAVAADRPTTPIFCIWTQGLNGLARLFAAINTTAGPAAARISQTLPAAISQPICYLILLVGGGLSAAVVGFIVGLPALRLRGDYLAIATLGFAEIIRIAIQNSKPLGGALGLTPIPKYTDFAWLYGAVCVTVIVVWRIAYSPKGRAIMAVREDEIAAASIGVNATQYKVTSFVIGAFFAGVAGALYALHERSITPGSFGLQKSIEIVVMVTLGGLGSISGAILAAIVLTALPEVLRNLGDILPASLFDRLPASVEYTLMHIVEYRMILYALLLVVMMLLRPQGLLGGREFWPKRRGVSLTPTAEPKPIPA
jgi:ABC-type branched-subunit amino acid transport system permease subunit